MNDQLGMSALSTFSLVNARDRLEGYNGLRNGYCLHPAGDWSDAVGTDDPSTFQLDDFGMEKFSKWRVSWLYGTFDDD